VATGGVKPIKRDPMGRAVMPGNEAFETDAAVHFHEKPRSDDGALPAARASVTARTTSSRVRRIIQPTLPAAVIRKLAQWIHQD
jgi:hypothetical protein